MPIPAVTAETAVHRVPYTTLHAYSALFTDYCTDYDALADRYAGDWRDPEARRRVAARTAAHDRDRGTLVEVLTEQNARWGLDARTRAHLEALRDPASVAVVTGQQMGLLTGPLYTPYKMITALQLTERLARETGRPVVPVFWLEGEDHDLDEVVGLHLLQRNQLVSLRYTGHTPPEEGNVGPVGRLVFTEQIQEVVDEVDAVLPPSDFKERLVAGIRRAYRPGTTLQDAFAHFVRTLFPESGFVFMDVDDPRLKRLVVPLYRREIEAPTASTERVREAGARLEETYHVQVRPRPTNLFLLEDDGRLALDAGDGGFVLRGRNRTFSKHELLALLDERPERFSPNVVLRPITQDLLLPTAAYVAGPSEVAYFAQYKEVYDWAGIPMPIIYPRASVTLVEGKVQKVLDKYGLTVADVGADPEQLFQRVVVSEMAVDVDGLFDEAVRHVHEAVNTLKPKMEQVDRTLVRSAEATRAALMKELSSLKGRVVRAEKRNHDEIRAQLDKARANVYPDGKPQERVISIVYYLNKYSMNLVRHVQETLSLDTSDHQVVSL